MSTSTKYDWDLTNYGTVGWNGILQSFQVGVDEQLNTYISGTLGATIDKDEVLYLDSDGTFKKAQAAVSKIPAMGVAIEAGNSGENVRMRRLGPYAPSGAASAMTLITGGKIYVDATTPGMWTQTKPTAFSQAIGRVLDADNVFIWIEDLSPIHFGTAAAASIAASDYPDGTLYFQYTA
jgi:hypothetical protein